MKNPSQKSAAVCVLTCVISLALVIDMKLRQTAIVAEQVQVICELREREHVARFKPVIHRILSDMGYPLQDIVTIEDLAKIINQTIETLPDRSSLIPEDVGKEG
ncbi:hypothetical protein RAS2_15450 [Phycisphaerae bacterium RAS2]|jgi:cupin superfamily acireductone dioxygenase involved in methionine salvage|nr:hypothetical protein RAS2_15450 [Phycisphaerae bacterium RAS2]